MQNQNPTDAPILTNPGLTPNPRLAHVTHLVLFWMNTNRKIWLSDKKWTLLPFGLLICVFEGVVGQRCLVACVFHHVVPCYKSLAYCSASWFKSLIKEMTTNLHSNCTQNQHESLKMSISYKDQKKLLVHTCSGFEKSGRSGTRIPTSAQTTMRTVHTPNTTTGQSAMSSA